MMSLLQKIKNIIEGSSLLNKLDKNKINHLYSTSKFEVCTRTPSFRGYLSLLEIPRTS